jgi:hypothetical protein
MRCAAVIQAIVCGDASDAREEHQPMGLPMGCVESLGARSGKRSINSGNRQDL